MTDSVVDFSSFRSAYWDGYRQLRSLEQKLVDCLSIRQSSRQQYYVKIHNVAKDSLEKLQASDYGRVLYESTTLPGILVKLENGFRDLINSMPESKKSSLNDCLEPYRVAVRAFHFWGRAGGIFARYSKTGRYVSEEEATQITKALHLKIDALISELEPILLLGIFHAAYPAVTVKNIEGIVDRLYAVDAEFSRGALAPVNQRHRDIFRKDYRSIARQFTQSIGLMCFELFGHLRPQTLHLLLDIKSSTAEQLGLLHWKVMLKKIEDSSMADFEYAVYMKDSSRLLREEIASVGQRAEIRARKANWPMLPVIEHFNATRKPEAAI